jgi:hypothetical protein
MNIIGGKKKKIQDTNMSNINNTNTSIESLNNVINKEYYKNHEYALICENYTRTPSIIPKQDRIIVLGDIHGDYELTLQMLKLANLINISGNQIIWTGNNTYVVQVGDQIDRARAMGDMAGDDKLATYKDEASDIKILKLFIDLDKQAQTQGGRVISLLGNHELMNSTGQLGYVSHEGVKEFESYKDPKNPNIVFPNGKEARKYAFMPGNEYGKFLGCTRLSCVIIGSNLFVHAGIVDGLLAELQMNKDTDIETINIAVSKWLLGLISVNYVDQIISARRYSMFWNRILGSIPPNMHPNSPLCTEHISKVLKLFKVSNIMIGHTPSSFLVGDGINSTCNAIWRVDNGASKAFHKFDQEFMTNGKVMESRKPQVLEILNDTQFNILK